MISSRMPWMRTQPDELETELVVEQAACRGVSCMYTPSGLGKLILTLPIELKSPGSCRNMYLVASSLFQLTCDAWSSLPCWS